MIPRLPPSSSDFVVKLTVNKRLRPYFEKWFNAEKKATESPANFILRKLKESVVKDYLMEKLLAEGTVIKKIRADEDALLSADALLIASEVSDG